MDWAYFAPDVPHLREWPLVRVVWSDGSETNPLLQWQTVFWDKPQYEVDSFGSIRWSNYWWNVRRPSNHGLWPLVSAYFCRLAQEHATSNRYPIKVEIYHMSMPRFDAAPSGIIRLLLDAKVCTLKHDA